MTVGGDGAAAERPRARLGQGQARQASVRAPLRLSHRMAALHRDARPRRRRRAAARRSGIVKAFADIVDAPGGLLAGRRTRRVGRRSPPAGTGPAKCPRRTALPIARRFWSEIEESGRIVEFEALRARLGKRARQDHSRCPSGCSMNPFDLGRRSAPSPAAAGRLRHPRRARIPPPARLGGFRPAPHRRQPGGKLACRSDGAGSARQCPAVRGVQPPLRVHPARHQESGQPALAARPQRRASRRQSRVPRRHGRDAAILGRQDERPARASFAAARRRACSASRRSRFGRSSPQAIARPGAATAMSSCSATPDFARCVDPDALEQAVGHLLQNAIDASSGTPVSVRVDADGDSVDRVDRRQGRRHGRRLRP